MHLENLSNCARGLGGVDTVVENKADDEMLKENGHWRWGQIDRPIRWIIIHVHINTWK